MKSLKTIIPTFILGSLMISDPSMGMYSRKETPQEYKARHGIKRPQDRTRKETPEEYRRRHGLQTPTYSYSSDSASSGKKSYRKKETPEEYRARHEQNQQRQVQKSERERQKITREENARRELGVMQETIFRQRVGLISSNRRTGNTNNGYSSLYHNNYSAASLSGQGPRDFTSHGVHHTYTGTHTDSIGLTWDSYKSQGHGSFCPGGSFPGEIN